MAIRNPAARNSAVIPAHITTRMLTRTKGFSRRAVYSNGKHIGYTTSHLGLHTAQDKNRATIAPPTEGHVGFEYLSNAVVAVAEAAERCTGYGESCGNPTGGNDLCPDCTMARLDAQSPRIHV